MFPGLMSTMLKLCSAISRFHRLIRRSSADKKVSWSLLTEMELMWYVCALANSRLHRAAKRTSLLVTCDTAENATRADKLRPINAGPLVS